VFIASPLCQTLAVGFLIMVACDKTKLENRWADPEATSESSTRGAGSLRMTA